MSRAYRCRPSDLLSLDDPWQAYDLDLAVLLLANRDDAQPAAAPVAPRGVGALMAAFPHLVTRKTPTA